MRVLIISHLYPSALSSTRGIFVQQEVHKLAEASICEVTLLTPFPWSPGFLWWRGKWKQYGNLPTFEKELLFDRYYIKHLVFPRHFFKAFTGYTLYLSSRKMVEQLHLKQPFDLIHAHTLIPDGHAGMLLGNLLNIPVVCTVHGSDANHYPNKIWGYHKMARSVIRGLEKIVAVSLDLKNVVEKTGPPQSQVVVIPNSVDTNLFQPGLELGLREQLGIPAEATTLIFVGSVNRDKGIFELLEAFEILSRELADLYLLVVGEGIHLARSKERVLQMQANQRVHFVGSVQHKQVADWMRAADIFVLPSYHEGMPCVIVEALSSGLPIVATDVGGIPEVVDDNKQGLLISPNNVGDLVKAIRSLCQDSAKRMSFANEARKKAKSQFSWDIHTKSLLRVYSSLV